MEIIHEKEYILNDWIIFNLSTLEILSSSWVENEKKIDSEDWQYSFRCDFNSNDVIVDSCIRIAKKIVGEVQNNSYFDILIIIYMK